PTLVLAGGVDPITPPVWALEAAVGLSAAQVVIIPGAGHSVIDSGECAQSLGIAFLNNPTAALDTSCASNFTVPWVVR
ncbi:MAG: alpha/beta hydrolase, partial [Chloroflexi bacterium]|nr:alpha/beta hydrolase [Chloroflexota bacterium]